MGSSDSKAQSGPGGASITAARMESDAHGLAFAGRESSTFRVSSQYRAQTITMADGVAAALAFSVLVVGAREPAPSSFVPAPDF